MEIIPGERPGTNIFHNGRGFYYHCSYVTPRAAYFKCCQYHRGCRGRAILYDTNVFVALTGHNHGRNIQHTRVLQLRHSILQSTRNLSTLSFREIVHREGRRFPLCIRSQATVNRMGSSMWRVRTEHYPPMPHTMTMLADILQDNRYAFITSTEHGNDNLFSGTIEDQDGHTHIILLSRRMMNVMENCRWLFADGHYASRRVNPPMSRIFNIATTWNYHTVYLGSLLIQSKAQEAYQAVFEALLELMTNLNPQYISCDFELAQFSAWTLAFPNAVTVGCFWHFCRAVVIKAFDVGLGTWIRRSMRYRRLLRMCCVLPLFPTNLAYHALFEICVECQRNGWFVYECFYLLLDYLEDSWINNAQRQRIMCVYGMVPRTNNIAESFKRTMRSEIGPHHPNTFAMLESFVRLEGSAFSSYLSLQQGIPPARPRQRSAVLNDTRIHALTMNLQEMPLGLRFAVRNLLFYGSNTIRGAYNYIIGFQEG